MGFLDKARAGLSNAGNRINQEGEEASYNSKIYDQKKAKEKALAEVGEKLYASYKEGKAEITVEVKELFEKAKTCEAEIEKLEKEKQEMIEKAKAERQERRDAANAADEEKKE
ncbi:MAG: hypothetical protein MJZ38_03280 [archaeon]|nr:hypothetical protein [archaeon]